MAMMPSFYSTNSVVVCLERLCGTSLWNASSEFLYGTSLQSVSMECLFRTSPWSNGSRPARGWRSDKVYVERQLPAGCRAGVSIDRHRHLHLSRTCGSIPRQFTRIVTGRARRPPPNATGTSEDALLASTRHSQGAAVWLREREGFPRFGRTSRRERRGRRGASWARRA